MLVVGSCGGNDTNWGVGIKEATDTVPVSGGEVDVTVSGGGGGGVASLATSDAEVTSSGGGGVG